MVVDTSARVAIILQEGDADTFNVIARATTRAPSAASYLDLAIVSLSCGYAGAPNSRRRSRMPRSTSFRSR
jgi:uncharacterized protein with PIN domain